MDWVNGGGGPLICAEEMIAAQWLGGDGLSAAAPGDDHDYDRACATRDYLETIACADGAVLVLGDEPLQSSFRRTRDGALAIVRWVHAEGAEEAERFLAGHVAGTELARPIAFAVTRGPLVMFDAAWRGRDKLADCARIAVQPGPYRLTTEAWEREPAYRFIVHRFTAAS